MQTLCEQQGVHLHSKLQAVLLALLRAHEMEQQALSEAQGTSVAPVLLKCAC